MRPTQAKWIPRMPKYAFSTAKYLERLPTKGKHHSITFQTSWLWTSNNWCNVCPAAASQAAADSAPLQGHPQPVSTGSLRTSQSSRHMLVGQEMASLLTTYSIEKENDKAPKQFSSLQKNHQTGKAFLRLPHANCNVLQSAQPTASHSLLPGQVAMQPQFCIPRRPTSQKDYSVANHQKAMCSLFPDSCHEPKDKTSG